jgi:hypothetical protein
MSSFEARGLQGGWLNGWLAALGATVLVDDLALSWRPGPTPVAVLHVPRDRDVVAELAGAIPDVEELQRSAIARDRDGTPQLTRKVSAEAFRSRAHLIQHGGIDRSDRSLEATLTDLGDPTEPELVHGPFDAAAPKGITIHDRVLNAREALASLGPIEDVVRTSLRGRGERVQSNGLGFDHRRLASGVNPSAKPYVDPVVELLAFFGLWLFPVRGDGRSSASVRQRGFGANASAKHAFRWPCWHEPRDQWAVDALLDRVHDRRLVRAVGAGAEADQRAATGALKRLGVHAMYGTVYLKPKGSSDTNRAFAGERLL